MRSCEEELPTLEGISVAQGSGKRKSPTTPVAPPPTEASHEVPDLEAIEEEEPLPLTQPGPSVDMLSLLLPLGGGATQANEPA
jgi:hypothetical protein